MTKRTTRAGLVAAFCCLLPAISLASALPHQGMTMDQVRQAYGAPARDMGAVGSPAITRWVYDGYTVYFERSRVIHVVRTQPLPKAPAAAPAPVAVTPAASAPAAPVYVEPAYVAPSYVAPAAVTETPAAPLAAEPEASTAPAYEEPAYEEPAADEAPVADAPQPAAAEPAPAALAPAATAGSGFRFDPVTGRLILDSEPAAEPAAEPVAPAPAAAPTGPTVETPAAPAPASAANDSGTAMDDNLEFDPETGTFRPKQ